MANEINIKTMASAGIHLYPYGRDAVLVEQDDIQVALLNKVTSSIYDILGCRELKKLVDADILTMSVLHQMWYSPDINKEVRDVLAHWF